jgi:hypothetical protein
LEGMTVIVGGWIMFRGWPVDTVKTEVGLDFQARWIAGRLEK